MQKGLKVSEYVVNVVMYLDKTSLSYSPFSLVTLFIVVADDRLK